MRAGLIFYEKIGALSANYLISPAETARIQSGDDQGHELYPGRS